MSGVGVSWLAIRSFERAQDGGERGIRTLAPRYRSSCLAGKRFRPLSHLSKLYQIIAKDIHFKYIQKHKDFMILCKQFIMSVILEIKVIPRARKQLIKADAVYDARCYVKSAPEDNKANSEIID